ncbi:hypothetical protein H8D36_06580 [archaeon]|nr:hypothetical protein [archaeon]
MKVIYTYLLIIVLIVLITMKFLPENDTIEHSFLEVENNSIITMDLSNIKTDEIFLLDKTSEGKYNLSLIYIVLFDEASKSLVYDFTDYFEERLQLFDKFMKEESQQKISSESKLEFVNVEEFGLSKLLYGKSIFDWIKELYTFPQTQEHNIVVFVPIYEMDWCSDGLSQGFNYEGKIFFCMEEFFNPKNSIENQGAVGLMVHKFLHGLGFNHQNQLFKQYQFLDWNIGLPETNMFLHGNFRDFEHSFFNEYFMKDLDLIEREKFEDECLDTDSLICNSQNMFFCKDSWGSFCQDIDQDKIVDNKDNYVFSSPVLGEDNDDDGIIDDLDLCNWNNIGVSGDGILMNPLKIKSSLNQADLTFSENQVHISHISLVPFEMQGGFIKFNDEKIVSNKGNKITVNGFESPLWRIQVFYEYQGEEFFRPFYIYFRGFNADFFYEKEWYYFNRFGCDVPISVDFGDIDTYDKNIDGLPDKWVGIFVNYDWDSDGFNDAEDTLPTVKGFCSNEFVKGVKDSDKDGFCDPGRFDFASRGGIEEFEIAMIPAYNEFSDLCPYIYGKNRGCPE